MNINEKYDYFKKWLASISDHEVTDAKERIATLRKMKDDIDADIKRIKPKFNPKLTW